jgi:hypothetical protein
MGMPRCRDATIATAMILLAAGWRPSRAVRPNSRYAYEPDAANATAAGLDPRRGEQPRMWVNSDAGTLPNVTIGKGERRVLGFYFPLLDNMRDAAHVPEFDLLWQVYTAARRRVVYRVRPCRQGAAC